MSYDHYVHRSGENDTEMGQWQQEGRFLCCDIPALPFGR